MVVRPFPLQRLADDRPQVTSQIVPFTCLGVSAPQAPKPHQPEGAVTTVFPLARVSFTATPGSAFTTFA